MLDLERIPVDRRSLQSGRGSGLEPRKREAGAVQALGERDRGRIAETPGQHRSAPRWIIPRRKVPVVSTTARQAIARPSASSTPVTAPSSEAMPGGFPFDDGQVRGFGDQRLHGAPVEFPVGLGARPLHGGPLASIEDPELDAGCIGGARHHAVQRVDFAHQMALAEPADRRIAGHLADCRKAMGDERGSCA